MLKRVKEIKNVGVFSNFTTGGKISLKDFTLIFGYNRSGKSTLSDILRSLASERAEIIQSRETIGENENSSQRVKLSFYDGESEREINYRESNWSENCNYDVRIFDKKFIDENIFTGLSINRENKENITDFVLGEENVELAEQISELKKERRKQKNKKEEISQKIEETLERQDFDISVESFVQKQTDKGIKEIEENIEKLKDDKKELEEASKGVEELRGSNLPNLTEFNIDLISKLKEVNDLLNKSFNELNIDAKEKIDNHVSKNFKDLDGEEESWIKKGTLSYLDKEKSKCPFCGQKIGEDEQHLIEIYQKYFSKTYQEFAKNVESKLNDKKKEIQNVLGSIKSFPRDNLGFYRDFKEVINKEEYRVKVEEMEELANDIDNLLNNLRTILNDLLSSLNKKIKDKADKPYKAVSSLDTAEMSSSVKEVNRLVDKFIRLEKNSKELLKSFKEKLSDENVPSKREEINEEIKEEQLTRLRLEHKANCEEFKKFDLKEIKDSLHAKKDELEEKREAFLGEYFDKINELFDKFGSEDYKIEKEISYRGDKPVIKLKINFKGKPIKNNDLEYVFSNSDRRALALAVFCARIELLDSEKLKRTIVVMDDPVTSFDSKRITSSIHYLSEVENKIRQIIVLSHYRPFIKKFLESRNRSLALKLLKITRKPETSLIKKIKKEEFLTSPYEKAFERIRKFIEREESAGISKDLRIFLENELNMRYRKQIYDLDLRNKGLKRIISGLEENGFLSEKESNKLERFKNSLNPNHHSFKDANEEDVRQFAKELFKFFYSN